MNATFRVSVRELVGFTYFSADITPGGSTADMLAGTQAHQAREGALEERFEAERPIRGDIELDGECVTVFGRMDAFAEDDPPCVEEIKLCRQPPQEVAPEHMAQARIYGALLMLQNPIDCVDIQVVYVNMDGEPLRTFKERTQRAFLLSFLYDLLRPWLAWMVPERERMLRRDASLKALAFPFAQYRAGQRELAVQVYTAITRKKRLFASLPTGTGKSAAVLFPALKALGEGKTRKIVYLTARTTARQSPLLAMQRMHEGGACLRVSTLSAKEKMCPALTRCHPDDCARAKGHFLRQPEAVQALFAMDSLWTDDVITAVADKHMICPFELALTLTELADVVFMDLNYAFDPFAQLIRLFKRRKDFTLLVDEAHHTIDRVRESLSGTLNTKEIRRVRALVGKAAGRRHTVYKLMTALLNSLDDMPLPQGDDNPLALQEGEAPNAQEASLEQPASDQPIQKEGTLAEPSAQVTQAAQALCEAMLTLLETSMYDSACKQEVSNLTRQINPYLYAANHFGERYAVLWERHGKERILELYCLSPAETIAQVTKGLRGSIFFSATLSPLEAMRELLGGTEEDACFSLPSPFPVERLAVVRKRIQTRYAYRQDSAGMVAKAIAEAVNGRGGKYIAYFPSYAYMRLVLTHIEGLQLPPLYIQENDMSEEARERFLQSFTHDSEPKLGFCVLGGLFSEGVDLPGEQLIGAIIVGVGLPTPSLRLKTLQLYYEERFGDGFLYAWMIPAMQKVSQAGGRVIRTEQDTGLVLLLDDRYYDSRYVRLLPQHWHLLNEDIQGALARLGEI